MSIARHLVAVAAALTAFGAQAGVTAVTSELVNGTAAMSNSAWSNVAVTFDPANPTLTYDLGKDGVVEYDQTSRFTAVSTYLDAVSDGPNYTSAQGVISGGHSTTTYDFTTNVTSFGGYWNLEGVINNQLSAGSGLDITVYDTSGKTYSYNLPTTTNGTFWGVVSSDAFIDKFSVTYARQSPNQETYTLSNLTYDGTVAAAVPEPESYALMLAGLAAVGAVARRRKSA